MLTLINLTLFMAMGIIYLICYVVLIVVGLLNRSGSFEMFQENTGKTVTLKRGFAFPYLFFGPFYPLFKGHISGFFLTLVMEIIQPFSRFALVFCYMERYETWLYDQGFRRTDRERAPGGAQAWEQPAGSAWEQPAGSAAEGYGACQDVIQPVLGGAVAGDEDSCTVACAEGTVVGVGGMYAGAQLKLAGGESLLIGRDGACCNLVIEDRQISRQHCEIRFDAHDRCYLVTDHSTNGVYLDSGSQLPKDVPFNLQHGSRIRLGDTDNVFLLR